MSNDVAQLLSAVDALSDDQQLEFEVEYARRRHKLLERMRSEANAELGLQSDEQIEAWAASAVERHRASARQGSR